MRHHPEPLGAATKKAFSREEKLAITRHCQWGGKNQAAFEALLAKGNPRFLTPEPNLASTPLRLALLCANWRAALALAQEGDDGSPMDPRDKEPCFQLAVSGALDYPDMESEGLGAALARLYLLGHSPNAVGRHNQTPLWRLLGGPSAPPLDFLAALFTLGVDPNEPSESGETPIMKAALSNRDDLIRLLLRFEAGDGPRAGLTPLERALQASAFDAAAVLLESPSAEALSRRDRHGRGPLWLACKTLPSSWMGASRYVRAEREAIVERLIELGADPLEPDREGKTPLDNLREPRIAPLERLAERIEISQAAGPARAATRGALAL